MLQLLKPTNPRAHAPQQEKPARHNRRVVSARCDYRDPVQSKTNKYFKNIYLTVPSPHDSPLQPPLLLISTPWQPSCSITRVIFIHRYHIIGIKQHTSSWNGFFFFPPLRIIFFTFKLCVSIGHLFLWLCTIKHTWMEWMGHRCLAIHPWRDIWPFLDFYE